ncbi:MAG: hypothetical protein FWE98_05140 [Oscillospiraceae bacterium]|nr:hypothetical protein [Oscillospiraceae bacterium]
MRRRGFPWALLLLLVSAALALAGLSILHGGFGLLDLLPFQAVIEQPTLAPVPLPAQFGRAGQLRFHYGNLSAEEKAAYDDILARLPGFPESVRIKSLESEAMSRVFSALVLDQPLLFQISTTDYMTNTVNGLVMVFRPKYRMEQDEYAARCEALAAACETFTVPEGGDAFDCELALHGQLVRRCAYSDAVEQPEKSTAYGAIVEGSASCEGYARAMQLLMDMQGIPCYIVTGKASNMAGFTGGHAWNKVRIGGEWYHLDATWDDPVTEDGGHVTSHAYFNLTDEEIGRTHEVDGGSHPCTSTAANYFVRKGLEFSALDRSAEDALAKTLREALRAGDNAVELRFTDDAAMQAGLDYLFAKQHVYRILNSAALGGAEIRTDKVYHADLEALRVVRILPVMK